MLFGVQVPPHQRMVWLMLDGGYTVQGFTVFSDSSMHRTWSKRVMRELCRKGTLCGSSAVICFMDDIVECMELHNGELKTVASAHVSIGEAMRELPAAIHFSFGVQTNQLKGLKGVRKLSYLIEFYQSFACTPSFFKIATKTNFAAVSQMETWLETFEKICAYGTALKENGFPAWLCILSVACLYSSFFQMMVRESFKRRGQKTKKVHPDSEPGEVLLQSLWTCMPSDLGSRCSFSFIHLLAQKPTDQLSHGLALLDVFGRLG